MKTGRKKLLSRVLVLALVMALTLGTALAPVSAMAEATLADGTYTGAANGMGGAVNVTVTVEGGKITSVEVGDNQETPGISDPAIEQIPGGHRRGAEHRRGRRGRRNRSRPTPSRPPWTPRSAARPPKRTSRWKSPFSRT